ncbi:hypothetical protein ACQ4PT_033606 [Festuca glaucescens]
MASSRRGDGGGSAVEQAGGAGGAGDGRILRHRPRILLDLARAGCRSSPPRAAPTASSLSVTRSTRLRRWPVEDPGRCLLSSMSPPEGPLSTRGAEGLGRLRRIDVLVNNAGLRGGVHSALDWPEDEWDKLIKTNLTGLWLVAKHVCRRMRDAKIKGSVINISSVSGLNRGHLPGSIGYTSSKSAVHSVTKLMALELGAHGIRVNSIAPGIFQSEITALCCKRDG